MKGLRLDDLKNEVTFATELIESIKSGPEPEKWKDTLAGFRRDRKKFKREIVRRIQGARKAARTSDERRIRGWRRELRDKRSSLLLKTGAV